ncbi:MAG: putative bifunctional diguanylate cyclase/phosphodiesterase [Hyphomicrobiaceae bacterium]
MSSTDGMKFSAKPFVDGASEQNEAMPEVFQASADLPVESQAIDLVGILSSVQETAYRWDIVNDRIDWESNAVEVLGVRDIKAISTASDFNFLVAPEHIQRRQQMIAEMPPTAAPNGAHYRVQYRFTPVGRRSDVALWLEDHGRCWFDEDGQPVRARGIIRVINERYKEEQRLLYRSDHDELTGQLNRIRLTDALGAVAMRAGRTNQSCAFLMAAVNNLAVINETFGFDVGDEVIAAVARIIGKHLRGGDTIGRYSSNKFGIILNDCGPGAMRIAAERFIKAVRDAALDVSACQLSVTISVGGVLLPDHAQTAHDALSHALQALETAKSSRQESMAIYEPSETKESLRMRNILIADEIIDALDANRMVIVLQPVVSSKSGEPDFYECLLRLVRPDGTLVSAGEFISVAEQLGLSRLIDKRTLELSIEILRRHPDIRLSVNVSSLTASDHEWLLTLHRLTGGRHQLTRRLIVELTETAAIHDLDLTMNFVDTLKELGCQVAIDDFGAGYTSFKNLKILDVDMVKIDGSFVKNLIEEPTNRVFIKTLVEIANTFNLETVAEWVSDEETARICVDCGITHMQGFYFGKPLLEKDLPQLSSSPGDVSQVG